ncbi:acetyl-CoA carboxylase carboxyl transferase subunit beta, partial [Pseudomonas sp. SIMBA_059]
FQRSEFLLEHGAIDLIISRGELRPRLARLLAQMTGQETPEQAREAAAVA